MITTFNKSVSNLKSSVQINLYVWPKSAFWLIADSESKDGLKSIVISASVHIHNAQTKATRYKLMEWSQCIKGGGFTSWSTHSIASFQYSLGGTYVIHAIVHYLYLSSLSSQLSFVLT